MWNLLHVLPLVATAFNIAGQKKGEASAIDAVNKNMSKKQQVKLLKQIQATKKKAK